MVNYKSVLYIVGLLLCILSVFLIIPIAVEYYVNDVIKHEFISSLLITAFFGLLLISTNKSKKHSMSLRQVFILTVFSWVILCFFASLPFVFSDLNISFTDSLFEAVSALTTTGATVLTGLDTMTEGILVWRSLLQWLGGIGIIVVALAVLPLLNIGGMQLFRAESSDKSEKVLPRAAQFSGAISTVYLFLTFLCAYCLWLVGMSGFDAILHAMTTIATSGFSTHDSSIGYFDNAHAEMVITIFMILSSIPFVLYVQSMRGRAGAFINSSQVKFFLAIWFISVVVVTIWLYHHMGYGLAKALRLSLFNITSIITTTGYATSDYSVWGSFAVSLIFFLGVIGGCTGSTTGGLKIFRIQVMFETAKKQISTLISPNRVFHMRFDGKTISDSVTGSVMSFLILFALCFIVITIILSSTGLDYLSSMSASAATISNLGPALGSVVGPSGNYSSLTDVAKWSLMMGMLIGRLEIFTVLVLLSPYFWKN